MATIETNDVVGVAIATRDEIIEELIPMIREQRVSIAEEGEPVGMGWLRDLPDFRDYTADHETVKPQLEAIGAADTEAVSLPPTVDLRQYCSPIENQGSLGSCTANATVGLVEYFERRAHGRHIDASRLFLYKATRDLLHWTGDTGAYLRSTMGALALFGVPPEEYWPYNIANYDIEPSSVLYSFAGNYRAIKYFRLDPVGTSPATLLTRIKTNLTKGLPPIYGFTVYNSISQAATTGKIPYPVTGDRVIGGHAMLVVGYDDNLTITNTTGGATTTGALITRNSWGPAWGDHGYGYLPYDYVTNRLAVDFWSLVKEGWTDTGPFQQ
jgi:C1A family cysteine protease